MLRRIMTGGAGDQYSHTSVRPSVSKCDGASPHDGIARRVAVPVRG